MDRKRSKKVMSLRAAGTKPVNKELLVLERRLRDLEGDSMQIHKGLAMPYVPDRKYRCKRRYIAGTNFSGTMTLAEGNQQFLVATSATAAVCYADIWRIRRIKCYCRNNEADYAAQVLLTPGGSDTNNFLNGVPKHFAVESQSSAFAMVLDLKPGKNTPLGTWHKTNVTNSSTTILALQTSSNGGAIDGNTIFEIEYEFILNIAGSLTSFSYSGSSGLTTGLLYATAMFAGLIHPLDVNVAP